MSTRISTELFCDECFQCFPPIRSNQILTGEIRLRAFAGGWTKRRNTKTRCIEDLCPRCTAKEANRKLINDAP